MAAPDGSSSGGGGASAGVEVAGARSSAGMTKGFPFAWKIHLETKYEGYRLSVKVDPDSEAPEDKGAERTHQIRHAECTKRQK